jgi:hypothetical protein
VCARHHGDHAAPIVGDPVQVATEDKQRIHPLQITGIRSVPERVHAGVRAGAQIGAALEQDVDDLS